GRGGYRDPPCKAVIRSPSSRGMKPPRRRLLMTFLAIALCMAIAGWLVAGLNYSKHMKNVMLEQNRAAIEETRQLLEEAKTQNNKTLEMTLQKELSRLEGG